MPPASPEPLRRVTLNLFSTDCAALTTYYGRGWTEEIREMVRAHVRTLGQWQKVRKTLGDLE